MKLIDTLESNYMDKLFIDHHAVGVFPPLIELALSRYPVLSKYLTDNSTGFSTEYYLGRSGNKTVSPLTENVYNGIMSNGGIVENVNVQLAGLLLANFGVVWEQYANTIIHYTQDSPDREFYINDTITADNSDITTYDITQKKTGANSDTTTYNSTIADNGSVSTHESTTRSSETANDVYGFNSAVPVGNDIDKETTTEIVSGDADKNVTTNTQTKSGNDSKEIAVDETDKKTGTDSKNFKVSENHSKHGSNIPIFELMQKDFNFRANNIIIEKIFRDIDSMLVSPLYY